VVVGQVVQLFVENAVSVQWNLPMSSICSGYNITPDAAVVVPPPPTLPVTLVPQFNFTRAGVFAIPFLGETPSGPVEGTFLMNVVAPVASVQCLFPGRAGFYPDSPGAAEGRIALAQADPKQSGVVFNAEVGNPLPNYGLQAAFIQVGRAARTLRVDMGGIQRCPANGRALCDNYGESPLYGNMTTAISPQGSSSFQVGDAPRVATHTGLGQIDEVWIGQENFETFLMVTAVDPGSVWFPLVRFGWWWSAHAVRGPGGWQTDGTGQQAQNLPVEGFPTWTGRLVTPENLEWGNWGSD
jgi:hypothetical protein